MERIRKLEDNTSTTRVAQYLESSQVHGVTSLTLAGRKRIASTAEPRGSERERQERTMPGPGKKRTASNSTRPSPPATEPAPTDTENPDDTTVKNEFGSSPSIPSQPANPLPGPPASMRNRFSNTPDPEPQKNTKEAPTNKKLKLTESKVKKLEKKVKNLKKEKGFRITELILIRNAINILYFQNAALLSKIGRYIDAAKDFVKEDDKEDPTKKMLQKTQKKIDKIGAGFDQVKSDLQKLPDSYDTILGTTPTAPAASAPDTTQA